MNICHRKHQIGVIGFGVWGCHSLERELAATGRCEIRRLHAEDSLGDNCHGSALQTELAAFAAGVGAEISGNWRDIIDDPDIDIVSVMTAPYCKPVFLKSALDAGKFVVTDKPLGMAPEKLRELRGTPDHALFMLAGYWNRPAVAEIMRMLRAGELGRVLALSIRLNFMGGIFPGFQPSRRWRSEIPSAELTTIGSHALVTAQKLLNEPLSSIYARTGEFFYDSYREVDAEDWAELNCRTVSGVPVAISVGRTPHRIPQEEIIVEVTGDRGYARCRGGELESFRAGDRETQFRTFPVWSLMDTFHACLDAWEKRSPQPVTAADGIELQSYLAAALRSRESNQPERVQLS